MRKHLVSDPLLENPKGTPLTHPGKNSGDALDNLYFETMVITVHSTTRVYRRRAVDSKSSQRYPGGSKDNAKLLRLVETQLMDMADNDYDLDLQLAWRTFAQADRQRRNRLSRDQVRSSYDAT